MEQKRDIKRTAIISALAAALVTAGILAVLSNPQPFILNTGSAFASDATKAVGLSSYTPKTIEYTLIAEETTLEIAPDVRVEAWTYNGTIPGPTLRATEGDRVIIKFINTTPLPHTIHLHGDHDEQDDGVFQEVQPGDSYTYDFIAGPAGALMYHCHVMPVSQHIRMGLYGAFIVDPQTPLSPAREYVLVVGEYDTKDQLTALPEYMMFNGYADQYWQNPLPAKTNELVRIYLINLSDSPAFGFHIHGTIFKAYPSGILENQPLSVQTWEVSAGNAAIFEVKWPEAGRYLFHLHGTPEEKGTMAYFNVSDTTENAVDGVDIANTQSISMVGWQSDLTKGLQKAHTAGRVSTSAAPMAASGHAAMAMPEGTGSQSTGQAAGLTAADATSVTIPKGSTQMSLHKTFSPERISTHVGDTVTWTNEDATPHTVTSKEADLFSSDLILQKGAYEHAFTEPGTYEYYCSIHPWMTGAVEVGP